MRGERSLLGRSAALLAVAALAALLWRLGSAPSGPVEPAWDRVPCAHCHMLVSDPRFAAQLHTTAGEVQFFDDPGCLLLARAEAAEAPAGVWFHDFAADGWLSESEVRFVPAEATPMGHGFAAVAADTASGGLDAAAALAVLRARPEGRP